jgi:hypothetical protein
MHLRAELSSRGCFVLLNLYYRFIFFLEKRIPEYHLEGRAEAGLT